MKRVLWLTPLFLALMAAGGSPARGEERIRFGCALSLSGRLELSGRVYRKAYDLAVEWINRHGGVQVGGRKHLLDIVYADDGSDPSRTSRLVRKLIVEDKVDFLLGPYGSESVLAAAAVAEERKIPLVHGGGAAQEIYRRGFSYVFGTLPGPGDHFRPLLDMLSSLQPRPRAIALAYADDLFDREAAAGLRKLAAAAGFNLVTDEEFVSGSKDFDSFLRKAAAAGPEVIVIAGHMDEGITCVRQIKEKNLDVGLICLGTGITESEIRKSLAADAEYICGVAFWQPSLDLEGELFGSSREFVRLFKEKYNEKPDYHMAAAVAAVAAFVKAIEKADTLDPKRVRDALAGISLESIYGRISFKPDGQIEGGAAVFQIQQGIIRQVQPRRDQGLIYPMPSWGRRVN